MTSLNAQEISGVPGQILQENGTKKIFFESDIHLEWNQSQIQLNDSKPQNFKINLNSKPQKDEGSNFEVIENDLGGNLKKKAPLAYKNPKLGNTTVGLSQQDPLKNAGLKVIRNNQEKTPEGADLLTTEYEDGSKNILYKAKDLKEESSFDNRGTLVWRNIEGENEGLKFKKTQWADGSVIREYLSKEGSISVVTDIQKGIQIFSFMNPKKEIVESLSCERGNCESE